MFRGSFFDSWEKSNSLTPSLSHSLTSTNVTGSDYTWVRRASVWDVESLS